MADPLKGTDISTISDGVSYFNYKKTVKNDTWGIYFQWMAF